MGITIYKTFLLTMTNHHEYSRRRMLKITGTALLALNLSIIPRHLFGSQKKFRIGACDWSIGPVNDIASMALAKKIGLDGLQLDLGKVSNTSSLWNPEIQKAYKQAAKKYGIQISSLAIGDMNRIPYKSEPETEQWVSDSIDVAKAMGCKVILLPFFSKGDLKGDEAGTKEVIRRLKKVAPKAQKNGIILGLESWLSADEHLEIIHAVGSDHVKIYYDVANSNKMGYDIYEEMERLGKKYICEIHAKENGFLLGQGKIDFNRVEKVLRDIDYTGWVVIESAVPKGAEVLASYVSNYNYLRSALK